MRFWFERSGEVSLREQIVAQVALGISSGELMAGARLPSTREMARRFEIHPNTVSAAYRQLEQEGRVELRRGSGVFVCDGASGARAGEGSAGAELDQRIASFFEELREEGVAAEVVRQRLRQWLEVVPPDHFLLVEPDAELRRIVKMELEDALHFPVRAVGFEECGDAGVWAEIWAGALAVTLPSKVARVREMLPTGTEMVALQVRSVPLALGEWLPARPEVLVGIVSRWPEFLRLARTMLVAAGFAGDGLVVRDAREVGWERGLDGVAGVVCDAVMAEALGGMAELRAVKVIPFRLVAEASLAELREAERGISERLGRVES